MRFVYFAWVRERIGTGEEELDLPDGIDTVAALLDWLATRSDGHAAALAQPGLVRVALDREHAEETASLAGVREIALFPPMTGG